jgi:hypothetical protein
VVAQCRCPGPKVTRTVDCPNNALHAEKVVKQAMEIMEATEGVASMITPAGGYRPDGEAWD